MSSNEPVGRVAVNIARSVNLSPATYKRAKYIIQEGSEQQKQKLREGKARIHTEYKCLQHVQRRNQMIAEAKSSKILDKFFKVKDDNNPDQNQKIIRLLLGDFREQSISKQIPDNSVDLIFTDPPYTTEYLPLHADLGKFACRVLKPGGSLIVYTGQFAFLKTGNYVDSSGLKYIWEIPVLHTGGSYIMHAYNLRVKHKPLLWFVKGGYSPIDHIQDVIESTPPDKSLHDWTQSTAEAEYMISKLTVENQIVLDPFVGGATTAIAALKLNRKFIGIEIEEDTFNIAKSRIAEFLSSSKKVSS
jgi:16S rRNA G966 N2-methylase RsmD